MEVQGRYEDFTKHLCSILVEEEEGEELAGQVTKEAVIEALDEQNDLRLECHVRRDGQAEWEHVNAICLERKDGRASKVLFTRQNITEVKEKEMRIQAEMSWRTAKRGSIESRFLPTRFVRMSLI